MSPCKMIRILLLPLLLFTLSMACTAQTFQYSRGWTNGKRAIGVPTSHYHRNDDDALQDLYEIQDGERKLEKCLLHLQRVLRNQMFMPHQMTRPTVDLRETLDSNNSGRVVGLPRNPNTNNNDNINNNNNNPYSNHHHQSNELFEELNAVEPNDYGKH